MLNRVAAFGYGVASYAIFFLTLLYFIGWLGGIGVPRSVDSAPLVALGLALAVDLGLVLIFAVQHSVMARPAFKRWWTRFVPAPVERSTYVLFSSAALLVMFVLWQPIGGVIWDVEESWLRAAIYAVFASGWVILFVSTFLINHFDLFGLRQVWLHLRGRPYTPLQFGTPFFYRYVRHPLYVGWLLGFWAAPTMTVTHLVFAIASTAYILIAIQFEERDLVRAHPEYVAYREQVPMLIPRVRSGENGRLTQAAMTGTSDS